MNEKSRAIMGYLVYYTCFSLVCLWVHPFFYLLMNIGLVFAGAFIYYENTPKPNWLEQVTLAQAARKDRSERNFYDFLRKARKATIRAIKNGEDSTTLYMGYTLTQEQLTSIVDSIQLKQITRSSCLDEDGYCRYTLVLSNSLTGDKPCSP